MLVNRLDEALAQRLSRKEALQTDDLNVDKDEEMMAGEIEL